MKRQRARTQDRLPRIRFCGEETNNVSFRETFREKEKWNPPRTEIIIKRRRKKQKKKQLSSLSCTRCERTHCHLEDKTICLHSCVPKQKSSRGHEIYVYCILEEERDCNHQPPAGQTGSLQQLEEKTHTHGHTNDSLVCSCILLVHYESSLGKLKFSSSVVAHKKKKKRISHNAGFQHRESFLLFFSLQQVEQREKPTNNPLRWEKVDGGNLMEVFWINAPTGAWWRLCVRDRNSLSFGLFLEPMNWKIQ